MKVMVLAAIAVAVVPIILAFSIPNWYLGDSRSDVEDDPLDQEPLLPEDRQR